jgi:hypothetical protein
MYKSIQNTILGGDSFLPIVYYSIIIYLFIGVVHSDEMIYLTPRVNETFNEKELKLSKMMVDMWVNFATSW